MNGWRVVNVALAVAGGRAAFIFTALWAADKLWPLPLSKVHPARVVVAHDGTPLWRFADAGIWRYPVTVKRSPATEALIGGLVLAAPRR